MKQNELFHHFTPKLYLLFLSPIIQLVPFPLTKFSDDNIYHNVKWQKAGVVHFVIQRKRGAAYIDVKHGILRKEVIPQCGHADKFDMSRFHQLNDLI